MSRQRRIALQQSQYAPFTGYDRQLAAVKAPSGCNLASQKMVQTEEWMDMLASWSAELNRGRVIITADAELRQQNPSCINYVTNTSAGILMPRHKSRSTISFTHLGNVRFRADWISSSTIQIQERSAFPISRDAALCTRQVSDRIISRGNPGFRIFY
jgi:hypothetical protein